MFKKINSINIDTSDLVKKKTDHNTKFKEIEKKIADHDQFNKLTSDNFVARLRSQCP